MSWKAFPPLSIMASVLLAGIVSCPLTASADLLLYEGFTGYVTSANLDTLTPNANTFGLALTGTGSGYTNASGSNLPTGMTINTTGLSLGDLSVSGGSVTITAASNTSNVASGNITTTTTSTDLWGSYLVSLGSTSGTNNDGVEVRLNNSAASSSSSPYFRADADSRASGASGLATAYDTTLGTSGAVLSSATTYLIISKFTNLGVAGAGTASVWALNLAQFTAFVAAGRQESFLISGNVTAFATNSSSVVHNWNTSGTPSYVEFVSTTSSGSKFDEVRYGESLADVTPVPEPATALLLGASLAGLAMRGRRL